MGWRAAALMLCLLPQGALGDVLTLGIYPTSNPGASVSCRIELRSGQINVVEVRGTGMPPKRPFRWPVRQHEEAAMLSALQALISGDLPGVDTYSSRQPAAPYVTITWSSVVNGARVNGLYLQSGLTLPPVLSQLLDVTMPGSGCQSVTD
jgi:hypothetical protein